MSELKLYKQKVTKNSAYIFRFVLFLTFLGHGLVSLQFSPSYQLHFNITEAFLTTLGWIGSVDPANVVFYQAWFDIALAVFFLTGLLKRIMPVVAAVYLLTVGVAAWTFYWQSTGNIFGLAEAVRRLPWIFFALFLYLYYAKDVQRYHLLRIGISMAFLAHGIASLGFFGLKGGHIELAANIIPQEQAATFVFYTGITDTILGTLLLTGVLSRYAAYVGIPWIAFVVVLSAMTAFPDAIFRTGFLVSIIYVALDERCHPNYFKRAVTAQA